MFTFIHKPAVKEKLQGESRWLVLHSWAPLVVIMVLPHTKIKHLNILGFTKQLVK